MTREQRSRYFDTELHRGVSTEARLRKPEKPFDKHKKTDSNESEMLQRAVRNLDGYEGLYAVQAIGR